jgi:hypothetical protein
MTDDQPRDSSSNLRRRTLFSGAASAVITSSVMWLFWKEQPVFAGLAVALYVMGGARLFPSRTPMQTSISAGVLVGIVVSTAMFHWYS